ncbi:hypothetical protein ACFO1V_07770 [Daeguia caeni]|uniref:Uncharacterized protein n=1 Tax=Daeguia caeni TaxID=439612 RepID=A0ABV9H6H2_9HYPH
MSKIMKSPDRITGTLTRCSSQEKRSSLCQSLVEPFSSGNGDSASSADCHATHGAFLIKPEISRMRSNFVCMNAPHKAFYAFGGTKFLAAHVLHPETGFHFPDHEPTGTSVQIVASL